VKITPVEIPRLDEIGIDFSALLFTFAVCCVTPLLFGLAPAFEMSRLEIASTLREGGRSGTQSKRQRKWMSMAVVSEYALTVVLLVGAGLLLHSFLRLRQVDPGFQTEHVLSMAVNLPKTSYQTAPDIRSFYDRVTRATQSIPGVEEVGAISDLPLKPSDEWGVAFQGKAPGSGVPRSVLLSWVSGDALKTLGMKLVAGRFISDRDVAGAPKAMVVNEALARKAWPHESPIGKRLSPGGPPDSDAGWQTVVGVVRDVRQGLSNLDTKPEAFQSLDQGNAEMMKKSTVFGIRGMHLVIKCAQYPGFISSAVQRVIAQQDPSLPVTDIQTLDQYVSASINPQRFDTYLVGLFAGLALLLAVIGISGVLSYSVAQRTNEMGVRMALGGNRGDIMRLVMTDGLKLAVIGITVGIAGAFVLARLISSLLYQTSARDAWTFLLIPLLLLITTIAASLIPAWRAIKIDPMVALRAE
jgi:predicted permease